MSNSVQGDRPVKTINPPNPFPIAVLPGVTWESGGMPMDGFNSITAAFTFSQIVTATIQKYLDFAGNMPVGEPAAVTTTADAPAWVTMEPGVPGVYFDLKISNAGAVAAVISNAGICLGVR